MKRKLDDVSRRIESLYDLLRENKVIRNYFLIHAVIYISLFTHFNL